MRKSDPGRIAPLARLKVGTKLMLLVLLPVGVLLGFTGVTALADWHAASQLQDFRAATRLSFATAGVAGQLATERTAAARVRLRPGAQAHAGLGAAQRDVNEALRQAQDRAADWNGTVDVAGRLAAARKQLAALRLRVADGSLSVPDISTSYGARVNDLIGTVGDLIEDRPLQSSGQASDAYLAMVQAIEAAQRERVDVAAVLGAPRDQTALDQVTATSRWATLEGAEFGTFRQNAPGRLAADLETVLRTPAAIAVRKVRDEILASPRAGGRAHLPGRVAGRHRDPDRRLGAGGERDGPRPGDHRVPRPPRGASRRPPQPGPVARGAVRGDRPRPRAAALDHPAPQRGLAGSADLVEWRPGLRRELRRTRRDRRRRGGLPRPARHRGAPGRRDQGDQRRDQRQPAGPSRGRRRLRGHLGSAAGRHERHDRGLCPGPGGSRRLPGADRGSERPSQTPDRARPARRGPATAGIPRARPARRAESRAARTTRAATGTGPPGQRYRRDTGGTAGDVPRHPSRHLVAGRARPRAEGAGPQVPGAGETRHTGAGPVARTGRGGCLLRSQRSPGQRGQARAGIRGGGPGRDAGRRSGRVDQRRRHRRSRSVPRLRAHRADRPRSRHRGARSASPATPEPERG